MSTITSKDREKLLEELKFPFCDDVNKYEILAKIGQGTFGEVFKARHKENKKIVAIKKVLVINEKEGFPVTALRENHILKLLNLGSKGDPQCPNVVNLIEVCRTKVTQPNNCKPTLFLVLDFCEHDLAGLLSNANVRFSLGEIKEVMQQLFEGISFIHRKKILHRDMKPANILITKSGVLKLADFGLARVFSLHENNQSNRYTNPVVTLWYRPPELLLGERNYGPRVDMWGAGCIMAEMWTRNPIMQGNTEQHQVTLICQLCGSFDPAIWPDVGKLELYNKMKLPKGQKRKLKERLNPCVKDPYACDLLDKLLTLDPSKRADADAARNHTFFRSDPLPCNLSTMLSQHHHNMFAFLTPPRQAGRPHPALPQPKPHLSPDSSFPDRIY
ncbi:hypothetical protein DAPPUDRAFT_52273 [Daphnia pulex]|uniref:Protein kinase domain-containing protein n=1 Tax=Daphnia pulex TaxID=6669 RepID=E9GLW8_DAPPU|nr:hypothetical protein DAPPUDRAFT_52273 [Daphnia pulex]|eukprot:EFX79587.1 hypothetical protein DAPPUDRAFT_52273 [Daphnia pulex]